MSDGVASNKETPMKKIVSLMLGLALVLGTAAFADDKKADTKTATTEKKAKKDKDAHDKAAHDKAAAPAK